MNNPLFIFPRRQFGTYHRVRFDSVYELRKNGRSR